MPAPWRMRPRGRKRRRSSAAMSLVSLRMLLPGKPRDSPVRTLAVNARLCKQLRLGPSVRIFAMFFAGLAAVSLALEGCDLPRDNADTLKRVRAGGELRVGVVDNPPWVRIAGDRAEGIEPALLQGWAERE